MKIIERIPYAPENGFRGEADLLLPESSVGAKTVLLIHGGGWNAMERTSLLPVAKLLVEQGLAVFNINYRLLDDAPWPACGDDCLRAAEFLLDAKHPEMAQLDLQKIIVAGASAGGHLTLMTGLRLPSDRVAGIIAMAGPADFIQRFSENEGLQNRMSQFFGRDDFTEADLKEASPVTYINADSPPVFCIHSRNDRLVLPAQSSTVVRTCLATGVKAQLLEFDGPGDSHGFWEDGAPSLAERVMVSSFRDAILKSLADIEL